LPGDVVVVVDGEPVDRQTGDLIELVEALGDARAAEQFGEGVRLVFTQSQRDLVRVRPVFLIGERDEVAVSRTVRDHAGLAAVRGHEGVQHADTGQFYPTDIDHGHAPSTMGWSVQSIERADDLGRRSP